MTRTNQFVLRLDVDCELLLTASWNLTYLLHKETCIQEESGARQQRTSVVI